MFAELDQARESYASRAWSDAYERLLTLDRDGRLGPEDLVRLGTAAYLIGRDEESSSALERAHLAFLHQNEIAQAVRAAFWLALPMLLRGDAARGGGWMARAQRLIDDAQLECVEQGYLMLPSGMRCVGTGDYDGAHAFFSQALKIGERFRDPDLIAIGQQCLGRAMIALGQVADGMALLDEVMVAVVAGEVSPVFAGVIYCSVVEACQELFDLRRAQEWTAALGRWCEAQPDLVPFRGQCLVHRSQVLQHRGAWPAAFDEVQRARDRLSAPAPQPALGFALYQRAELHRLRGDLAAAEQDYRRASELGHPPQPGLAQLRLAQGRADAAVTSIRHAVQEAANRPARARLLGPFVEIMLAAADTAAARAAADELWQTAAELDAPLLRAMAEHARGAVLLAEGDPATAVEALRSASSVWAGLEAPYEQARSRVLLGLARQKLGDTDTAQLELDAARQAFLRLGAGPDATGVDALVRPRTASEAPGGLSPREIEVIRLVAAGLTNHAIAEQLFLSEKTVARHISNIFAKLGISSRSAATAYAYQHDLV